MHELYFIQVPADFCLTAHVENCASSVMSRVCIDDLGCGEDAFANARQGSAPHYCIACGDGDIVVLSDPSIHGFILAQWRMAGKFGWFFLLMC